jgi:hypothetical protein
MTGTRRIAAAIKRDLASANETQKQFASSGDMGNAVACSETIFRLRAELRGVEASKDPRVIAGRQAGSTSSALGPDDGGEI